MKKKILSMAILGCLLVNTAIFTVNFTKHKTKLNSMNNKRTILTTSSIDPTDN